MTRDLLDYQLQYEAGLFQLPVPWKIIGSLAAFARCRMKWPGKAKRFADKFLSYRETENWVE